MDQASKRIHAGITIVTWLTVATMVTIAAAVEQVTFKDASDISRDLVGESIVTAQDGGRLFQADDGRIWTIQPDRLETHSQDDAPIVAIDNDEISRRLLGELPAGFAVYQTAHYVIVHNTSGDYVRWVAGLLEQLRRGFYFYWANQGWDLPEPKFPLVALVFANRASFDEYAVREVGDAARATIGYYNLQSNRMTTFNMPNPERNVATIIHEATHQLAYNTGVQKRFADNPMWVSEGLAMFFEAPDFSSSRGWRAIGKVNVVNLARFQRYLPRRGAESLSQLISDDMRFRQEASAADVYSEAWAMTYFLLRTHRKQYVAYLLKLSQSKPLDSLGARERIAMFEESMEADLATIDKQFLAFMAKVRP